MQPSAILESALYVTDLDAAEAFYRDVLGLERIAKVDGRHVFFRCGRGVLRSSLPNQGSGVFDASARGNEDRCCQPQ